MSESTSRLRDDAISIWSAGVRAVSSKNLVASAIHRRDAALQIAGHEFDLSTIDRVLVVGTGKAGAGMATAVETSLGEDLLPRVSGFVNVPEDCVRSLQKITLHGARPAGVNEPTQAGVDGAETILQIVRGMSARDLCLVLISGGGSALLPCPAPGISLEDKQTVTRLLMHGGATINELNAVRKQLSSIKGGGLARASKAGTMISLIISDVIDDPLDIIASGPTVEDESTPALARDILNRVVADPSRIPKSVLEFLQNRTDSNSDTGRQIDVDRIHNHVIGNNRVCVQAAAVRARELGYQVHSLGSGLGGIAREIGRDLADLSISVRDHSNPLSAPAAILSGGEPVVQLAETDLPRKGGRNQELILAACQSLQQDGAQNIVILSGGTDGEDGPTDAAGAFVDSNIIQQASAQELNFEEYLAINNSYQILGQLGALLKTGPTHTNVMDLRVALIDDPAD